MILCVVCKEGESLTQSGAGAPLCRPCRAEITLTAPDPKLALEVIDRLFHAQNGKVGLTGDGSLEEQIRTMARGVKCEACGGDQLYDPEKKKKSYFCDGCDKSLCPSCAAYCSHKDWNYQNKILCKNCRAEKSLTGQPVEEVEGTLPGQETAEAKREPKPHCGRTTCVEDPRDAEWDKTHPHPITKEIDYKPFCVCPCAKCKEAVASGFMDPMFGKMTPDPDPEPEPADDVDEDLDDEQDALAREAGQA